MSLRKCASCGGDLPAGATSRAKFCSSTCRLRAHRAKASTPAPSLALVRQSDPVEAPTSQLAALESAAARLVRLLDEADPRTGAALNKEYRETLREIEALRNAAATPERGNERDRVRRPFSAAAI